MKNIPLWVAHYGVLKPDAAQYIGFQYSDSGSVPGIAGPVDLNDFNSGIFLSTTSPLPVNSVVKEFQHAVNIVGLTDNIGNKLVEDGIKGTYR